MHPFKRKYATAHRSAYRNPLRSSHRRSFEDEGTRAYCRRRRPLHVETSDTLDRFCLAETTLHRVLATVALQLVAPFQLPGARTQADQRRSKLQEGYRGESCEPMCPDTSLGNYRATPIFPEILDMHGALQAERLALPS